LILAPYLDPRLFALSSPCPFPDCSSFTGNSILSANVSGKLIENCPHAEELVIILKSYLIGTPAKKIDDRASVL
jgi:hypothetical protein